MSLLYWCFSFFKTFANATKSRKMSYIYIYIYINIYICLTVLLVTLLKCITAWEYSKYGVFSDLDLVQTRKNTDHKKTPYLDTFLEVYWILLFELILWGKLLYKVICEACFSLLNIKWWLDYYEISVSCI